MRGWGTLKIADVIVSLKSMPVLEFHKKENRRGAGEWEADELQLMSEWGPNAYG
jgi:hypothetical protein